MKILGHDEDGCDVGTTCNVSQCTEAGAWAITGRNAGRGPGQVCVMPWCGPCTLDTRQVEERRVRQSDNQPRTDSGDTVNRSQGGR